MDDPSDRDPEESALLTKKREFLESFFKKGAQLTRDLLRETDHLRRRIVQLEDELAAAGRPAPSQGTLEELLEKLHALEREKQRLLARVETVESESARFADRYGEMEREASDLASLYVAQSQLHASLEVFEVVQVIIEVLLNFVGAQRFALYAVGDDGKLHMLASEGVNPDTLGPVAPGPGVLGSLAAGGEPYLEPDACTLRREPGKQEPTVAFALREGGRVVGAVAVWCFLPQKEALEELDRRMFELLWTGAGCALEAARLAARARGGAGDAGGTVEEYRALIE